MLGDITIGQYFPTGSLVHRLDPRVKLVLVLAYIVLVFLAANAVSMGLTLLSVLTLILISKVPLKTYLKTVKAILPIILLTSVLNAVYVEGDPLFKIWFIQFTEQGVIRAAYMSVRILLMIVVSALLTYTTSPTELTDGIERLCSPLRFFHLENAVHTMAMMMTIALRFIPTLIEETEKIMNAQKARGANLDTGGLMKRIRALLPILIPLLVSSFRRAAELADAMECRCYTGGKGRTKMKVLRCGAMDYAAALGFVALFAVVIVLNVMLRGRVL